MTNYIVGSDYGYCTSPSFSAWFMRIDKVAKITKTGIVTLENGKKFNANGKELRSKGVDFPRSMRVEVDYILNTKIAEAKSNVQARTIAKAKELLNKTNNPTDEQMKAIEKLIESFS